MYKKVLFKESSKSDFILEGYFMEWGLNLAETRDTIASYSIALIKLPDGTVKQIIPEFIKFVEP